MASASEEPEDFYELRIVLLGVSSVGKSSTGNAILGREAFKETTTTVSEIQRGRVEDRNISVIDTPGFFNPQLTDEDLQNEMMKSLSLSHPGPHVFLLIINLQKLTEDDRNLVKLIQEIVEESSQFIMILFIGRENMSRREFTQFIENEKTEQLLNCVKRRYHVMNSKQECDAHQIKKLLKNIEKIVKDNGEQCYNTEQREATHKRDKQQKKILYQQETERGDMRKHKDVGKKRRDAGTVKWNNPDVLKDFRTQMKCPREKESEKWALQRFTQDTESRLGDLRIVLLGKTGVGKSSTGNTILGRDAFIDGIFSTTTTCEKQTAVVNGKTLSVIDTPGLLDGRWYRHFKKVFERHIKACLEMSAPGPHVFLLVISLRSTEKEKNTTKWIQENLGEDAVQHTIILFTHANELIDEPLDEYFKNNNDMQTLIKSCVGRYHPFNNEDRSNRDQVTQLLEKIEKLVKENGGQHYNNEMCLKALRQLSEKEEDMRHEKTRKRQEQKDKDEKNAQSTEEEKNIESKEDDEAEEDESSLEDTRRELCELLTGQLTMLRMHLGELALMSLERRITQINLPRQDLRIVLLGYLGSGKSSTGNTILGRDAFGASMLSTTEICEKQETVKNGKTITIIDTPSLLVRFQDHLEFKIEKCVEMCAPGPHVFLLVIRLGVRITEEEKNTVKWIQKNFDEDVLNHTIVLFTWADLLDFLLDESLTDYIQKNHDLRSLIDSCGGRYHSFNNTAMTDRVQVIELLFKIDKMMQRNEGKHYNKRYISKSVNRKQVDAASCEIQ